MNQPTRPPEQPSRPGIPWGTIARLLLVGAFIFGGPLIRFARSLMSGSNVSLPTTLIPILTGLVVLAAMVIGIARAFQVGRANQNTTSIPASPPIPRAPAPPPTVPAKVDPARQPEDRRFDARGFRRAPQQEYVPLPSTPQFDPIITPRAALASAILAAVIAVVAALVYLA